MAMICAVCGRKFLKGFTVALTEHKTSPKSQHTKSFDLCPNDSNVVAEIFRGEVLRAVGK